MQWPSFLRRTPQPKQAEFANDVEMQRIAPLAREFFTYVLFDEEPLFVSDEASIWDCSMGPSESDLLDRCTDYYGFQVIAADFKQPLWMLIEHLNRSRTKQLPT